MRLLRAFGVVALVAACAGCAIGGGRRGDAELDALVAAVGTSLPFDARPAGGFRPPARTRGVATSSISASPDVRIAIARIEKRAAAAVDTATQDALGVAYLVNGDVDRAVRVLEDAAAVDADARVLNDLSAAHLVKAQRAPGLRIESLVRAFDAAARSLRARDSSEARFNKALALESLARYVGAPNPWTEYIAGERDAAWREAARVRAATLAPDADASDRWNDRHATLRSRLDTGDAAYVDETARLFPEGSLETLDREVYADWALAVLASDAARTAAAVRASRRLSGAIAAATGDPLPSEETRLIEAASREPASPRARLLAKAHTAYIAGMARYDADDYANADAAFATAAAAFAAAGSPYRAWPDLLRATILYQRRRLDDADRQLTEIERRARTGGYRTLLGRALALRGLVESKRWRLMDAFAAVREATSAFEAAGEAEYAAGTSNQLADALRALGDHHESWMYIGKTLESLSRMRKPTRRYLFLYNASLFASSEELFDGALVFQDAALRAAGRRSGVFTTIEALTERASLWLRVHDLTAAARDVQAARDRLDEVPAAALRRYAQAEVDVAAAQLAAAGDGTARVDDLQQAIGFFGTTEPAMVPRLFLTLATTRLRAGDVTAGELALASGIEQLERRQSQLADASLKMSYFDEGWQLYPEMIAAQLARHDPARAFEFAERSRARLLAASALSADERRPRRVEDVQRALPDGAVLAYYVTLRDRLVVWAMTRTDVRLIETRVAEGDLARLVARHLSWMAEGRSGRSPANDALAAAVLAPLAGRLSAGATLIVAADGALQRLPFATLIDPAKRRYLVDDHPIVYAPSATLFVATRARVADPGRRSARTALLVGDPQGGGAEAGPAALPGAAREAVAGAAFYPNADVLIGRAATRQRFVDEAPRHAVVHFGGHAVVNAEYPLLSRLLFAADGDGADAQPLFAHEIASLDLRRTELVVLAACSTAAGAISRGEGVVSIARPFLAAGVPTVIASQWDVDDRATEALFVAFHRALTSTGDPIAALQTAQRSLLHGSDPSLATPASWGGFLALGTMSR